MGSARRPPVIDVVTLARPPMLRASGEVIAGRFELVELYGSGPLGHTYRARDREHSGTWLAVKVVAAEVLPTSKEREGFVAELQKLASQKMQSVATPKWVGLEGGVAFVVAPWVAGKSLRRVLGAYRDAGRPIPVVEALGVIEGVVRALRELHAVCAHGAVYPENVQITRDGRVVLTDAGFAGAISRARLVEQLEKYPDVWAYVAPEVRSGKAPSAGADLFAVGALASELLTGEPGAASVGIAGAMVPGITEDVERALADLVAMKASRRARALPALLEGLAKLVGRKSLPITTALPRQVARTDVLPVAGDVGARVKRNKRSSG